MIGEESRKDFPPKGANLNLFFLNKYSMFGIWSSHSTQSAKVCHHWRLMLQVLINLDRPCRWNHCPAVVTFLHCPPVHSFSSLRLCELLPLDMFLPSRNVLCSRSSMHLQHAPFSRFTLLQHHFIANNQFSVFVFVSWMLQAQMHSEQFWEHSRIF